MRSISTKSQLMLEATSGIIVRTRHRNGSSTSCMAASKDSSLTVLLLTMVSASGPELHLFPAPSTSLDHALANVSTTTTHMTISTSVTELDYKTLTSFI